MKLGLLGNFYLTLPKTQVYLNCKVVKVIASMALVIGVTRGSKLSMQPYYI